MSLHEMFPAVHAAEMTTRRNPCSWDAWQTLGRAQLELGEIALKIYHDKNTSLIKTDLYIKDSAHQQKKSKPGDKWKGGNPKFSGIFPMNPEVWKEDLSWARKLQEYKEKAKKTEAMQALAKEATQEPIPDYDFERDEIVAVCAAIAKEKALSEAKSVMFVSASDSVETVTEEENCATTPDDTIFIRAR